MGNVTLPTAHTEWLAKRGTGEGSQELSQTVLQARLRRRDWGFCELGREPTQTGRKERKIHHLADYPHRVASARVDGCTSKGRAILRKNIVLMRMISKYVVYFYTSCKNLLQQDERCVMIGGNKGIDRQNEKAIIRKNNMTEPKVAIMNSPVMPNYVTFDQASDVALYNNLLAIKVILTEKLKEKEGEERRLF